MVTSPDQVPYPLDGVVPSSTQFPDHESRFQYYGVALNSNKPMTRWIYFLEFLDVWADVCNFCSLESRTVSKPSFDPFELVQKRAHLNLVMHQWFHHLPENCATVQSYYSEMETATVPSWKSFFVLAFYHRALILLHLPCFIRALKLEYHEFVDQEPAFLDCLDSALEIMELAKVMTILNPLARFQPPRISRAISVACRMLAVAAVTNGHVKRGLTDADVIGLMNTALEIVGKVKPEWPACQKDEQIIRQCQRFSDLTFVTQPVQSLMRDIQDLATRE